MPNGSPDVSRSESRTPLRLGPADAFASARAFLQEAGFDAAAVCRALAIEQMNDFDDVAWDKVQLESLPAPLRWCITVFLRGDPTPSAEAHGICGEPTVAAMLALGLLRPAKHAAQSLVCPVWLYPVDGFVAVSDRRSDPDGEPYVTPDDIVFPGIYAGTLEFLRLMPDARGGDALDLCGGCGVGALHLSRTARAAVTSDVTPRSALFAAFTIALNGVAAESLCGDMYAPVHGRQFDVITAHPPFVPASGETLVFRDGGDAGEDIIQRAIEGLPTHLRPGGTALIVCAGRDTVGATFEHRARAWLGVAAAEFDILFALERVITLDDVVRTVRMRAQPTDAEGAEALRSRLLAHETSHFVYGALVLRRYADAVVDPPLRLRLVSSTTPADFERLLRWRAWRRKPEFSQWLVSARPRFARSLELNVRHVVDDGRLVPSQFQFRKETGFPSLLQPDGWVVPVLTGFDGRRSVAEGFAQARADGALPEGFALSDLAGLVGMMIERGFLDVEYSEAAR